MFVLMLFQSQAHGAPASQASLGMFNSQASLTCRDHFSSIVYLNKVQSCCLELQLFVLFVLFLGASAHFQTVSPKASLLFGWSFANRFRPHHSTTSPDHHPAHPVSAELFRRFGLWPIFRLIQHMPMAMWPKRPPALGLLPLADCPITRSSSYLIGKLCKVNILFPKLWGRGEVGSGVRSVWGSVALARGMRQVSKQ